MQGNFDARKAGFKESLMQRRSKQGRFDVRKILLKESSLRGNFDCKESLTKGTFDKRNI